MRFTNEAGQMLREYQEKEKSTSSTEQHGRE
jgi:hypothetical protein